MTQMEEYLSLKQNMAWFEAQMATGACQLSPYMSLEGEFGSGILNYNPSSTHDDEQAHPK